MRIRQGRYRTQRGHAALLFALLIPVFWGFTTLAIDGSYAIQTKARLGDASEVAALALTAKNSLINSENEKLALKYVRAYVDDAEITIKDVKRKECSSTDNNGCEGVNRYAQYDLSVAAQRDSWIPNLNNIGFGDNYNVSHSATARKYQGDSIDVVFVMDYSGSMDDTWQKKAKYRHVADIINSVLKELKKYQSIQEVNSRVGLVPYSEYTSRPNSEMMCEEEKYLLDKNCKNKCKSVHDKCLKSCSRFNWKCREKCNDEYSVCQDGCRKVEIIETEPLQFVDQLRYAKDNETVDIESTIADVWVDKSNDPDAVCAFERYEEDYEDRSYPFSNEDLTDNFDKIEKEIKRFKPEGWTAALQGIIKAAQMFDSLDNPAAGTSPNARQLLVILTDGVDKTGSNDKPLDGKLPLPKLVDAGMCTKIKEHLNSKFTLDNRPVSFQMAMIGFDYDVSTNKSIAECVGVDNVYDAANPDELLDIILNLISEEIGHLK
ncbi:VWA domain-containing protein [Vibrio owensii]|uniref:TadE/TadG family type IV pilus assembly protein n=1 Tax=Vibrio owensii TaxID=696485 RepID=UPI0010520926|nr:TadE/TadG family type IV pilus assembly protein [Vibrio owensii]TDE26247.1 VWA domain-containing protein [Vibrio owensii]